MITFVIKSGTGGWYNDDGCDYLVCEVYKNLPIPKIGETVKIFENRYDKKKDANGEYLKIYHEYLVTNVLHCINNDYNKYGVRVYVVPIGGKPNYYGD